MKVFAISDLHLSINSPKPMDIFGPVWDGYLESIEKDWNNKVSDDDVVLIAGDISWAMRLREAIPDLEYIGSLKGNKVIIKGNHDYWWSAIGEVRNSLADKTYAIQNDAIKIGNIVICGSRGWAIPDGDIPTAQDEKLIKRELIRMELSLKSMSVMRNEGDKVIVMTHFPPFNYRMEDNDMTRLFEQYGVDVVVFGHLHKYDKNQKMFFEKNGVKYYLTSCDLLGNKLQQIEI
ncbi:MAG: serine/threonine protein phosphatase [Clostridiales bacterium]|nr:serine/threonine protein phosphatase [Clostridiales bacterium]